MLLYIFSSCLKRVNQTTQFSGSERTASRKPQRLCCAAIQLRPSVTSYDMSGSIGRALFLRASIACMLSTQPYLILMVSPQQPSPISLLLLLPLPSLLPPPFPSAFQPPKPLPSYVPTNNPSTLSSNQANLRALRGVPTNF